MKLHLGCGRMYKEGYINCDIGNGLEVYKKIDLEKPIPFGNDLVEEIIIEHTLEHIKNINHLFEEMYRICKNNAIIKIRVPYFSSESTFSTMTHTRFFTWTTLDFLDADNPGHYDAPNVDMKTIKKRLYWRKCFKPLELLFNLFPRVYQELFCWWLPARELYVKLEVNKKRLRNSKQRSKK